MVSIGTFRWLAESVALSRVQHLKSETGAHAAGTTLCCNKYQIFQIKSLNKNGRQGNISDYWFQEIWHNRMHFMFPKTFVYQHKTERATNTKATTRERETQEGTVQNTAYILIQSHNAEVGIFYRKFGIWYKYIDTFLHGWRRSLKVIVMFLRGI